MPETSGIGKNGNNWTRSSFVVEYIDTADSKQKRICFSIWNKSIGVQVGTVVDVVFSMDSVQYNGKWFTNVTAHEIKPCGVQPQVGMPNAMPQQQPYYTAPQQPQYNQPQQQPSPQPFTSQQQQQSRTYQNLTGKNNQQQDDDMPF